MAIVIICDNCEERDDCGSSESNPPFFPGGVVLRFRGESGSRDDIRQLDLCASCRGDLLKALPWLAETLTS